MSADLTYFYRSNLIYVLISSHQFQCKSKHIPNYRMTQSGFSNFKSSYHQPRLLRGVLLLQKQCGLMAGTSPVGPLTSLWRDGLGTSDWLYKDDIDKNLNKRQQLFTQGRTQEKDCFFYIFVLVCPDTTL